MTPRQLVKIKGNPNEIYDYSDEIPSKTYIFEESLYDVECETVYEFYKVFFGSKLHGFSTTISIDGETEGKDLFYKINEHMTKVYSEKKPLLNSNFYNYFNNGIVDTLESDKLLTTKFGTDNGAIGISVSLTLDLNDNTLNIYVYRLE